MDYYILYLATNSQLLHLFNTMVINVINTNTKVISKVIHIDLMVLDTIIHKRSLHIYLHNRSQKDCFHTHIYLIKFKSCTILYTFYKIIHKRTLQIYFIYGTCTYWCFPGFPHHKDWASNGDVHCASLALCAQNSEDDSCRQLLLLKKDSADIGSFSKMLPVVQSSLIV
jgi:hypothetical protein